MGAPTNAGLLRAALEYRKRGWSIIPVNGKKPVCKWKQFQSRLPTEEELRRMFTSSRATGEAVIPGKISGGLWVRDMDIVIAYERWKEGFPDYAKALPTVVTARAFHVYGVWPDAGFRKFCDGELRGDSKHYCVLPPSQHYSSDHIYAWREPPPEVFPEVDPQVAGLSQEWCSRAEGMRETEGAEVSQEAEVSQVSDVVGGGFKNDIILIGKDDDKNERRSPTSAPGVLAPAQLIESTLPRHKSENHAKLFDLARGVKALEEEMGRILITDELCQSVFRPWYTRNQYLRPGVPESEYFAEFLEAMDDARFPLGQGIKERTWKAAKLAPRSAEIQQLRDPRTQDLAAWCRELQRELGTEPFFLGTRDVAAKLGLASSKSGTRFLHRLMRKGILVEVEKGGPPNRATRFRYVMPVENRGRTAPASQSTTAAG